MRKVTSQKPPQAKINNPRVIAQAQVPKVTKVQTIRTNNVIGKGRVIGQTHVKQPSVLKPQNNTLRPPQIGQKGGKKPKQVHKKLKHQQPKVAIPQIKRNGSINYENESISQGSSSSMSPVTPNYVQPPAPPRSKRPFPPKPAVPPPIPPKPMSHRSGKEETFENWPVNQQISQPNSVQSFDDFNPSPQKPPPVPVAVQIKPPRIKKVKRVQNGVTNHIKPPEIKSNFAVPQLSPKEDSNAVPSASPRPIESQKPGILSLANDFLKVQEEENFETFGALNLIKKSIIPPQQQKTVTDQVHDFINPVPSPKLPQELYLQSSSSQTDVQEQPIDFSIPKPEVMSPVKSVFAEPMPPVLPTPDKSLPPKLQRIDSMPNSPRKQLKNDSQLSAPSLKLKISMKGSSKPVVVKSDLTEMDIDKHLQPLSPLNLEELGFIHQTKYRRKIKKLKRKASKHKKTDRELQLLGYDTEDLFYNKPMKRLNFDTRYSFRPVTNLPGDEIRKKSVPNFDNDVITRDLEQFMRIPKATKKFEPVRPPPQLGIDIDTWQKYVCLDCGDEFLFEKSLDRHYQRKSVLIQVS